MENSFKNIKLIVFDVDGVFTDGRIYINDAGVESKAFHTQDGQGTVSYTHLTLPTNREV